MRLSRREQRRMHHYMKHRHSRAAGFFVIIFMFVTIVFFALYASSCYSNLLYGLITLIAGIVFLLCLAKTRNKLFIIIITAVVILLIYLYVKCPGVKI